MWVYNPIGIPYVVVVIDVEPIRERFSTVAPFLDERGRRLVAAAEAFAAGYGGIAAVAMATGMAPSTIGRGLKELAQDEPSQRVRRPGAGRKPAIVKDPTLVADLEALVEPTTRGDPQSPLLIADGERVYNPCAYHDRLLLGLSGIMSEAELHQIKLRLHQGERQKAARGELRVPLPAGLAYGRDPDWLQSR